MQAIHNIAEILAQKGITHAIISPGSRCAPLTIALVRHPKITTRSISDERSAGFIALGLAQTLKEPVVLLCTSGSAALNYGPAIAEAFYRNIPLIVLTADRPTEWIDQLDGQTIRQQNIFGQHVKASYHIPADHTHPDQIWFINRSVNEAVNIANAATKGPVHLNIALREPLYPGSEIVFDPNSRIIEKSAIQNQLTASAWKVLANEVQWYQTILIVAGQDCLDRNLIKQLNALQEQYNIVVVGDIISNVSSVKNVIKHHDVFISKQGLARLKPDLLLTIGLSLISKGLKQFIRNNKPKAHWHIQNANSIADTFQTLTRHIATDPMYFLENIKLLEIQKAASQKNFWDAWQKEEVTAKKSLHSFFETQVFGEFETVKEVIDCLNDDTILHLSNSMTVRYANIIGTNKTMEVMANRGTSGIDGSTSTAIGASLANDKMHILLTGDMAFFYDRNALWNKYLKPNLKIVVLNNHAGGIFRIIDGPKNQPELEEYFETSQSLNAKHTAEDHQMAYFKATTREEFHNLLPVFLAEAGKPALFEIMTDSKTNAAIFEEYKERCR